MVTCTEISPFIDVTVVPAYGRTEAQIFWRLRPGYDDCTFTIKRSPDGLNDWREIGQVTRDNFFRDSRLITDGRLSLFYYQVSLVKHGKQHVSAVINTLGGVTREEFGAAHYIMQQEYRKLSQCTRILVFKLKTSAPVCAKCTDPDSSQQIGIALCQSCYGTGYEGGFWPAAASFMQIVTQSPAVQLDSADGAGSTDPVNCKVRMLAYPQLIKNDMLVDPNSDRRYVVEVQDISYLKGKIPLVAMTDVTLLPHSNIRYKVPLL